MDNRMTADEIRIMYRDAKNKKKQICILAEINDCKPADIRAIINKETDELPPMVAAKRWTRVTEDDKAEILRLHGTGLSESAIASRTGRSWEVVSNIIKEAEMTFTEEQTPKQNEKLLQEITAKISPEPTAVPIVGVGVAEIAGALMDFITDNLHGCIVEVRAKDDGYIVHVTSETDDIVLTRRTNHEKA